MGRGGPSFWRLSYESALVAMKFGASYFPGERDPLYSWWRSAMYEDGTE